jgi:DNA polymerase
LIAADYSAIEARVLNWVAGQEDMLENFRAYDAGDKSRDPYVQNAMKLYSLPFEKISKHPHRQTGKFQELACGYQMGATKAVRAAKEVYGLIITDDESPSASGAARSLKVYSRSYQSGPRVAPSRPRGGAVRGIRNDRQLPPSEWV